MLFNFSTPVLIKHLWQLKTVVFLHWCLICALLLLMSVALQSHKITRLLVLVMNMPCVKLSFVQEEEIRGRVHQVIARHCHQTKELLRPSRCQCYNTFFFVTYE